MSGHTPTAPAGGAPVITPQMARRAALGSFVGAVVEWYDYLIYSVVAALVFSKAFFPDLNPTIGQIAAFGTFALGFVFRPLGGAFFGHFGDKLGPKRMLLWTIVIMGAATAGIGVLPTYHNIGMAAPVLLVALRCIQGFAVGGEWGGAALMATSQAPKGRKAFFSSGVQMGYGVGLVLANGMFLLIMAIIGNEAMIAWGWRIPFFFAGLLTLVGLWVRNGVADIHHADVADGAVKAAAQRERAKRPLVEALTQDPVAFFQIIGIRAVEMFTMFIVTTFGLQYSANILKWESSTFLGISVAVGAISLITIPVFALMSDKFGRKPIYLAGAVVGGLAAFPFFNALQAGSLILTWVFALVLVNIAHDAAVSVQQPLITELFGAKHQYSGAGFGYQVAAVVVGGFTPMVATWIQGPRDEGGLGLGAPGVAWYIVLGAVVSFFTVLMMSQRQHAVAQNA
ncbi:MAG: MFS transporter [Propioniciclava sp.]|uniref:MFS transporter n=1 Tax=Propioniciclava sp. TaxID=2038686 RepID=UPI0039E26638